MNTLTILVMGKGGVGKSSTVNSIIGEKVVPVSTFQVFIAFLGHESSSNGICCLTNFTYELYRLYLIV